MEAAASHTHASALPMPDVPATNVAHSSAPAVVGPADAKRSSAQSVLQRVGEVVGLDVVGASVGDVVGPEVEGDKVGVSVGTRVGTAVDGDWDGATVGDIVGD